MALVRGHGKGAGVPRIEVLPADELPAGVPAPARPADVPAPTGTRDEGGRYVAGTEETSEAARRAAQLRWDQHREEQRIRQLLGRVELPEDHPVRPYREDAGAFHQRHCVELARAVGGGQCGPGPSSVVATASLQMAASRWLFDLAAEQQSPKLVMMASRLGDAARQNLLAAFELCAREAASRPDPRDEELARARAEHQRRMTERQARPLEKTSNDA